MSLRETGLLETLQKSLKYVPAYEIEQRMKERAAELLEKGGTLARSEMVLTMLGKGLSIQDIAEISGLSVEEIKLLKREG